MQTDDHDLSIIINLTRTDDTEFEMQLKELCTHVVFEGELVSMGTMLLLESLLQAIASQ